MPTNPSPKSSPTRRTFLQTAVLGTTARALAPMYAAGAAARDVSAPLPNVPVPGLQPAEVKPFELDEITIPELQDGMKSGKYTARFDLDRKSTRLNSSH